MNLLQELIDIWVCKELLATGRLHYPLGILPTSRYVSRMNIERLCKNMTLIVVRRSDKPKEDVFNKFDILKNDAIARSEIHGMSMNLLGGAFKHEYIGFNPIGAGSKTWDGSEKVFYSNYQKCINLLSVTTPIFFEVANLHNIEFPYQRSKDKNLMKLLADLNIKSIESDGKLEFSGKSYISHEPTLLNYWHVEFQIRDIENKPIERGGSTWKKEAANSALQHIISVNALSECPDILEIPKSYFWK